MSYLEIPSQAGNDDNRSGTITKFPDDGKDIGKGFKSMKLYFHCIAILFVFFSIFLPRPAHAAGNFTTDYHVTYTIDGSGVTHAQVNVTLTNSTTQYYASTYKMQIGFDDITNVRVQDSGGSIQPLMTKNQEGYAIELNFNQKAVGMGAKQSFVLAFDTSKLARHYGKIWEIDIPGIANPDDFSQFTVELKVPPNFGPASYIKPKQANNNTLIFTKESLGKSGISIAFGEKQIYSYRLVYHLKNPNLYPIDTEIALPPSTNYQHVSLTNIVPRPDNIVVDTDGNWIAKYHLASTQQIEVVAEGKAEVSLKPSEVPLSADEKRLYTRGDMYWETTDPKIRELAGQLRTPEAIYAYVVNTLKYDFKRVTEESSRLGPAKALQQPDSAVCREYTDLFIALARAAGIPAREIDGFAYTENARQRPLAQQKDILHVWPEYYDEQKKTWVMVDPTWGSTTGGVDYFDVNDFAHFAFVRKGVSSQLPLPAGAYAGGNAEKDVLVDFAPDATLEQSVINVESTIPEKVMAGLPIKGELIVTNTTTTFSPSQLLYISSTNLSPNIQTIATGGIPPFGHVSIPIAFKPTSFLTNTQGTYTIRVAGATTEHTVLSAPFFLTPLGGGLILGIFAIIIFVITIRSWRVRLSRRR